MKKIFNSMWVLALVLTTSMVFTACSEKNDDPNEEVEQGKLLLIQRMFLLMVFLNLLETILLTRILKTRLFSSIIRKRKNILPLNTRTKT